VDYSSYYYSVCPNVLRERRNISLTIFHVTEEFRNQLVPSTSSGTVVRCLEILGYRVIIIIVKKGKAVPLQVWSDPEGSRKLKKLRFPDYMRTALDGGKVVSLTHWPP